MSISTYAELQTAVTNWLHRASLGGAAGSNVADDLITLGEARIYRDVRARAMEVALSATIASGVISVPSDYVELKHAYVDTTPVRKLQRTTADYVYERFSLRSAQGTPLYIAREGSSFIFGPYPDSEYGIRGIYYKRFSALSTAVNAFFTANPDLFLFAALAEARAYLNATDQFVARWEGKYSAVVAQINAEARGEEASGGGLHMRIA